MHIICLSNFYNGLKIYFDKMKLIFQNIDTQCSEKVSEFSTKFKNTNIESINSIYKLTTKLKEDTSKKSCKILDEMKEKYFLKINNFNKNLFNLENIIQE